VSDVFQVRSVQEVREQLARRGFTFEERPNQAFLARLNNTVVNAYHSGKVMIQGGTEEERLRLVEALGGEVTPKTSPSPSKIYQSFDELPFPRVGIDEAGKGDFFGPLVIAAVRATSKQHEHLREMGVRDSKRLTPNAIESLAQEITTFLGSGNYAIVEIGPRRYNQLYEKIGNLNELLAWGHARALENILQSAAAPVAISDQFGDAHYVRDALLKLGKKTELVQRPKAEEDAAVAAASVLARHRFVRKIAELSAKFQVEIPKGSTAVEDVARKLVAKHGAFVLADIAKIHFKTTARVVHDPSILRRVLATE
jgi:ribonuclease HIII